MSIRSTRHFRASLLAAALAAALPLHAIAQAPPADDQAEAAPDTDAQVIVTPVLEVGSAPVAFPYGGATVLGQDYIDNAPRGNGDIGTLLRINPSVQFADKSRSSRNMGEIRPADFSINGAPFYQNLFLLDGVSFNNDIDPAATADTLNNVNHFADVPSQSQGIAVDTDMLESVTVHDSNVPAAWGGFAGGVVDARSRRAGDAFSGKVWFRMARSAWDHVIIPEGQETSFEESANFNYQSEYDKYRLGVRLEGRSANGLGVIGTISRTRSEIPLRGYNAGRISDSDDFIKTQVRENTAASVALDWRNGSGLELGANISYAPTDDRYFIMNTHNAWFDLKSGGPVIGLRANIHRGAWSFANTLSYSDVESSRRSQVDYFRNWAKSEEFDWGTTNSSLEGSWGNVDQHDRKIGLRTVADRDPFAWGATRHALQFGLSWQHRMANYKRLNDHYNYQQPRATTSCALAGGGEDSDSCSLSPVLTTSGNMIAGQGQYFSRLFLYRAGEFKVSGNEWAAWLQDDITIGNVSIRPGLRLDSNSIWDTTTVSPRLAAAWDVRGTGDSVLTAGANRYHGRNFFSYLLREGRESLRLEKNRASSAIAWDGIEGETSTSTNRISDVDIPYTDEWTIGWMQRWAGMDIAMKYVNRENRDEVLRQRVQSGDDSGFYSASVFEYVNNGRSSSEVYTLSVSPRNALRWGSSSTRLQFAFDHTDVRRNYNDYETAWNENSFDELVRYEGDIVRRYDLPAADFNRPWTTRLSTRTTLPLGAGSLSWSNFLRYRAGFRDYVVVDREEYQDQVIDVLEDRDYPRSLTWDGTLEYALDLPRDQQAYIRVEANNLTNRSNRISGTTTTNVYYEPGRSYWLEVGYRF